MAEPTNAVIWIENNVINFFAGKYRQPTNLFNWDSNVRKAFSLLPPARWKSLGRELNRKDWLISIHVIIDVDSSAWGKTASIGEITSYLHDLFESHRGFLASLNDKDLGKLLAASSKDKKEKKKPKVSKMVAANQEG